MPLFSSASSTMTRVGSAALFALFALTLTHCSGETTKDAVGTVTKKTAENIKGAVAGIAIGIEEGRKQVTSSDGAVVIDKANELDGKITIEIIKHVRTENGVAITISFANTTEQPYRITGGIFGKDAILALDKEGFVARAKNEISDLTVPPQAKDVAVFHFEAKETPFSRLRAFGKDYPLPAQTVLPASPAS